MTTPALALLFACARTEPSQATWLEGFSFGWDQFNHRLSRLTAAVGGHTGEVGFVGGTSTTGVVPPLSPGCDASSCEEVAFVDGFTATLGYGRASSSDAAFAVGSADLVVGKKGGDADILVDVVQPAATLVAILQGVALTTDEPLEGDEPACYDPSNGWQPRRLQVQLGIPVLDGDRIKIPVHAAFEAGNTLEAARSCIDDAKDFAEVGLTVRALLISTTEPAIEQQISGGMDFPFDGVGSPPPQIPTDAVPLDGALTPDAIIGWTGFDFAFDPTDPDERGVYLRTIDLRVDLGAREAAGQATSYSPGTQLAGFEYTFSGTLAAVHVHGEIVHGSVSQQGLAAALDEDGAAVLTALPLQ